MRFSQLLPILPGSQCTRGCFQEQKQPSFLLVGLISTSKNAFLCILRCKFNGPSILENFNKHTPSFPDSNHERSGPTVRPHFLLWWQILLTKQSPGQLPLRTCFNEGLASNKTTFQCHRLTVIIREF